MRSDEERGKEGCVRVTVHGPVLITTALEKQIRDRLVEQREIGKSAAMRGFYSEAERAYGEEHALSWVLDKANCRKAES